MADATLGLSVLANALSTYFVPLAAASGLTLALQEAVKKLLSLRGRFHRRAVLRWLAEHPANLPDAATRADDSLNPLSWVHGRDHYAPGDVPVASVNDAWGMGLRRQTAERYSELVTLTSGLPQRAASLADDSARRFRGIDRALFELETPRMMAQLQDAAEAVLSDPRRWPALYVFFTRGCDMRDASDWRQGLADGQAERFARMKLSIRRQLDAFQAVTQLRWEDLNQLWAVLLGALILFVAQVLSLSAAEAADVRVLGQLVHVVADVLSGFIGGPDSPEQLAALVARGQALAVPLLPAPDALSAPWQHWVRGAELCSAQGIWLGVLLKSLLGGALAPIAKDLVTGLGTLVSKKG